MKFSVARLFVRVVVLASIASPAYASGDPAILLPPVLSLLEVGLIIDFISSLSVRRQKVIVALFFAISFFAAWAYAIEQFNRDNSILAFAAIVLGVPPISCIFGAVVARYSASK